MQNARLTQEQTRDEQQMLEPVASDGSMDNDGRTPDPNSGIESHDGADTDSRTAVMDVEQTGSEIRPSDIREEQRYDSESYSHGGSTRYDRCQEPDGYGDKGAGNHAGAWFEPALYTH